MYCLDSSSLVVTNSIQDEKWASMEFCSWDLTGVVRAHRHVTSGANGKFALEVYNYWFESCNEVSFLYCFLLIISFSSQISATTRRLDTWVRLPAEEGLNSPQIRELWKKNWDQRREKHKGVCLQLRRYHSQSASKLESDEHNRGSRLLFPVVVNLLAIFSPRRIWLCKTVRAKLDITM